MDSTALTQLHARLTDMGFQGDASQLRGLLGRADFETLEREVIDHWMGRSQFRGRFVERVLAHARKRQLGFRCEDMEELCFSAPDRDKAVRITYVEISLSRFRLVFFRGSNCVGHMYFNWDGLCLEWVSNKAERKNKRALEACL